MHAQHRHDYIRIYESTLEKLKVQPLDRNLQHEAVLALARAGALDFAMSEYNRYGLAAVRDHEDIMALNGRLSKDLFLRSSGQSAAQHASDAARKYEEAFQNTLGYYSGINSATMAFMADLPWERVVARIDAIKALLPGSKDISPTERYFIEATRAECFLLEEKLMKAAEALRTAIDFDPLNFAAHASTLRQFEMILNKREDSLVWLAEFRPPHPIHYAGHIHLDPQESQQKTLSVSISDALQKEDVGFGFGALAAGSDILFAENLLDQGGDLHVILPCEIKVFKEKSIIPFGENWDERFETCLAAAHSVTTLTQTHHWPDETLNRVAGLSAIGHAILKAKSLSVRPLEMLILRENAEQSYTATHAQDWAVTGYAQYKIGEGDYERRSEKTVSSEIHIPCSLKCSDGSSLRSYSDMQAAIFDAIEVLKEREDVRLALHINFQEEDTSALLDRLVSAGTPQSILATEAFATVLAAVGGGQYNIIYAGQIEQGDCRPLRCYTINMNAA